MLSRFSPGDNCYISTDFVRDVIFRRKLAHADILELVSTQSLQRLAGKCISLSLSVPDSRLFTNEMNMAISKGIMSNSKRIKLSGPLLLEIQYWLFLEHWSGFLRWRDEKHLQILLSSVASSFAWGGVFFSPDAIPVKVADC